MNGVKYYRVKKNGFGYWEPSAAAREAGFKAVACGPDGEEARGRARKLSEAWDDIRRNRSKFEPPDIDAIVGNIEPKNRGSDRGYVYFMKVGRFVKIGFSTRPATRMQELHVGQSKDADLLFAVRGTRADEKAIHYSLSGCHSRGEWFEATPSVMALLARSLMAGRAVHAAIKDGTFSEHFPKVAGGATRKGFATL